MEFRDIQYFVAVAEELHFGRAARRLFIAQPPLSQRIGRLEEQLGYRLFTRTSRRVELTPQGRSLLAEAQSTLASVEAMQRDIDSALAGEVGSLRIAFTGSMLFEGLPAALRAFRAAVPEVEVDLIQMTPADQVAMIESRRIDVGIAWPSPESDLEAFPLEPIELLVAMPARTPTRHGGEPIELRSLADSHFLVTVGDGTDPSVIACRERGFEPTTSNPTTDMTSAVGLVGAGLGVALVPRNMSRLTLPNVTFRAVTPPVMAAPPTVMWRRDRASTVLNRFLRVVRPLLAG